MGSVLYIEVGHLVPLYPAKHTVSADSPVTVIAAYRRGRYMEYFDSIADLISMYPTKEKLIYHILNMGAFEGAAILDSPNNGDWELDSYSCSDVEVVGFPGD